MRFVVDRLALGLVLTEYFGFPYQSLFHQMFHIHHLVLVHGPVSGRRTKRTLTPAHEIKKKKEWNLMYHD
jgi:hypothetical protein